MSDKELLQNAINCAKDFKDFSQVLMAVSLHPEWLTKIPDDRQWSILHQIILSGNVNHLEQLLALQKSNTNFRLLTNTRNGKTISDVASSRQDIPEMKERVEHLVKLDEMLNHARSCRWNECYNLVKENPSFVNEKPAYRRYYLIHHMACANAVEEYKRFKGITDCKFDLHLRADRKKCNVIAQDRGNLEFATFIESECPGLLETDDDDDEYYAPSAEATQQTTVINNTMMEQKNIIQDLDQSLMGGSTRQKTRAEVQKELEAAQCAQNTNQEQKASTTSSDEEVIHKKMVLSNLTCPLTFATFIDPVLAADGFTYERLAISKWLEKNDRSPMTNQTLLNKNLNTNRIVEQILHVLRTK